MKEIEQMVESHMKNILKFETGIQVPIHLVYLDDDQISARYTVKRYELNFLQYMLHQNEAQQKQPVRGEWFSYCTEIVEKY